MKRPVVIYCGIFLLIVSLVLGDIFQGKSDLRLNNVHGSGCLGNFCTVTRISCAMICKSSESCVSFNYRQSDGSCQLNNKEVYDVSARTVHDSQWKYFGPPPQDVKDGGWILVFLARSGINVAITDVWNEVGLAHDLDLANEDPAMYSKYNNVSATTHYRSHWMDVWSSSPIAKVKFVLYTNGSEVVSLVFNGTGSSKEDWFSSTRLLSSNWKDLDETAAFKFSIAGTVYRKFLITKATSFEDCSNPFWLIVLNREGNRCQFDKYGPRPQFIYSHYETATTAESSYKRAETMAVFISM